MGCSACAKRRQRIKVTGSTRTTSSQSSNSGVVAQASKLRDKLRFYSGR